MYETSDQIVPKLSREKYDRIPRLNWSSLKLLKKSPAHFRHNQLERSEDTDARKLGRCTHLAVFEPERFRNEVVLWDGGTRRGKLWDAFQAEHAGQEILTETEWKQVQAIQQSVRNHPLAAPYLTGGQCEVSMFWTHKRPQGIDTPAYEVECKGRIDFRTAVIADLKTTRDASPAGFARESWRYGYHTQAAWYVDGIKELTGLELPYVIVAVETAAPHVVSVFPVPPHVLQTGRMEYRQLLDTWHRCQSTNSWPAYLDGPSELELPQWATNEDVDEDPTGLGLQFAAANQ